MQLSSRTEWIAIGVLIAYLAFFPSLPIVRDLLSNPVGKAVGLGVVVYVWKYVSKTVGLLLALAVYRAGGVREGLETDKPKIMCEAGKHYDTDKKACVADLPKPPAPPSSSTA